MTNDLPSPDTIKSLNEGAAYALAMLAGMQLDVWTPLKDGPRTAEQIADALDVRTFKIKPLLYALVAAGLLTLNGDTFANTPEAQRYLVDGGPDSMLGTVRQLAHISTELLGTAESIRTGVPQSRVDFSGGSDEQREQIYDRQYPQSVDKTSRLLKTHDFSSFHRMADVGGGSGAFAITMTKACPNLRATVVDFPSVIPFTRRYIERAGAGDRVDVQVANAVAGPISGSFDVAVLKDFIQVLTADEAPRAINTISKVIEPGGAIYIWGAGILDDSMVSPMAALRFGLSALNRWDEGQAFTDREHREWLTDAGFENITREVLPEGESVITARKRT